MLTLRLYTNDSIESLMEGNEIVVDGVSTVESLREEVLKMVSPGRRKEMAVDVYLSCGIPFVKGTLDEFMDAVKPTRNNVYAVLYRESVADVPGLDKNVRENLVGEAHELFSPLGKASEMGVSQVWALLRLICEDNQQTQDLVNRLGTSYRFAPFAVGLSMLRAGVPITRRLLVAVTGCLYTIFGAYVNVGAGEVLDYAVRCMAAIDAKLWPTKGDAVVVRDVNRKLARYYPKGTAKVYLWKGDANEEGVMPECYIPPEEVDIMEPSACTWLTAVRVYSLFETNVPCIVQTSSVFKVCLAYGDGKAMCNMDSALMEPVNIGNPWPNVRNAYDSNLSIHRRKVDQVIAICVDKSPDVAPMLELERRFMADYQNQSFRFRVSTVYGAATYGDAIRFRTPFGTVDHDLATCVDKVAIGGEPNMYYALGRMVAGIYAFASASMGLFYPLGRLRILLVTSGVSNDSPEVRKEAVAKVIESGVILDVILLQPPQDDVLVRLSHMTGGSVVVTDSNDLIKRTVESEAFLSLGLRKIRCSERTDVDREFPNIVIETADEKVQLLTAMENVKRNMSSCTKPQQRLQRELRDASALDDPCIHVFISPSAMDKWYIIMKGMDNTPYAGKWFYLFATFPPSYPRTPPLFKFISIPFHVNISSEGRICLDVLEKTYVTESPVTYLIMAIRFLLAEPNYDDPIDQSFKALYSQSPAEFTARAIRDAAAFGKDSVDEWVRQLGL